MDERLPSLSVVVPHYGDPSPAQELCRQLLRQGYRGDLQIVVSDDCSPVIFPSVHDVEVVRRNRNGGFGATVNTGVTRATGDLLLILNSDLTLPPDFLNDLVLESAPLQPALTAPLVSKAGQVQFTARRFPKVHHQLWLEFVPLQRFKGRPLWNRLAGLINAPAGPPHAPVDWVAGVAMLVPRSAFVEVGGFDERFYMYAEEIDLQARLAARGVRSYRLGVTRVEHQGGGSSDPAKVRTWMIDSRLRYADKWGGGIGLRTGLVVIGVANLVFGLACRAAGRDVDLRPELSTLRHIIEGPLRHPPFPAE